MSKSNILVRSKIKKAQVLLQQNKLEEARNIYQQLSKSNKSDININLSLAVIYRRMELYNDAENICQNLLVIHPDNTHVLLAMGSIQQCIGNIDFAINCCKKAVDIDPLNAETYYFLGNLLRLIGQLQESANMYQKAIELRSNYLEALSNKSAVLIQLHQLEEARSLLNKANLIRPNCEQVLCNYSELLFLENKLDEAISKAEEVLKLSPEFFDALYLMGKIYKQKGNYDMALDYYYKAHDIQLENENVTSSIAHIMEIRGEYEKAIELLRPIINKSSNHPAILLVFSALSRHTGEERNAIRLLEELIEENNVDTATKILTYSELGKHYDLLKEYDAAFKNYRIANEIERSVCTEDDKISTIEMVSTELINSWTNQYNAETWKKILPTDNISERPIFVVGMPRSGTSLTEQILASHPDVFGAGELTDISRIARGLGYKGVKQNEIEYLEGSTKQELKSAAEDYLHVLEEQSSDALRVVNKMPTDFRHLGLISILFPNARVIHMVRDPRDTCLSIYFQRFGKSMVYTTDMQELGEYYSSYQNIMRYWEQVLDTRILHVRYEELIKNQESVSRQIINHCGLEWSEDCLKYYETRRDVNTPSYDQVRKPIYKKSIERWKYYEKYIGPLIEALGN